MAEVLERVESVVPEMASPLIISKPSYHPYAWLTLLTVACLLPFSGRAFHVDDTLFVMAARHITHHPLDPYGFRIVWNDTWDRMADVTENPPLACYYAALVGKIVGWSERAMHIGFLLPALALSLGTYRLATHFTRFPLLATLATILTPGVITSDTTIMCDPMMAALWVWAMVLWIEGLEPRKPAYLAGAAVLMGAAFVTKYFGGAVVPLLAAYSVVRLRRVGNWLWYLLIPVGIAVAYLLWTHALYGHNLLFSAVSFSNAQRQEESWVSVWTGLSFTGGCILTTLTLAPLTWSRKMAVAVGAIGAMGAWLLIFVFTREVFGARAAEELAFQSLRSHWVLVGSQLTVFIAGGLLLLGLTITDLWKRRDADSLLLALWVVGTFVFFSFLNWTVNARGVLPLIPAAGTLIARRLESQHQVWTRRLKVQVASALLFSAAVSFWVAAGDERLANSTREAAYQIQRRISAPQGKIWYWGHWGFQYYMDRIGAVSLDIRNFQLRPGDTIIVSQRFLLPEQKDGGLHLPKNFSYTDEGSLEITNSLLAATMNWELGAGFYSSQYGPLPFTFGHVHPERFQLLRVMPEENSSTLDPIVHAVSP